ncbi:MAG: hypothetical protein HFH97_00135 [Lachnospiraceae bacterium]|nr:DUF6020 family protein [uncultured Acetatifactor sp.]MCI9571014.1 hypothetical protein [Lachnospiraceae bacterium]
MKENRPACTKTACLNISCKSFLTAYALCAVFHAPLDPSQYETAIDLCIASIYELLGAYDLKFLLLSILSAFCYGFAARRLEGKDCGGRSRTVLACLFALFLLLGQSYHEAGDSSLLFGSLVNFLKSALAFAGFSCLFHALTGLAWDALDSHSFQSGGKHFFTERAFSKSFLILLGAYLPFLLLAFPGNLCWDAIGQIEQVIGDAPYSAHHPLFHTLIMGGLVKAGEALFHSPEIGLFTYMLLQDAALAAALAATISVLSRRGAGFGLLLTMLLLYCLTPVYSNIASTALKDVPYSACVIVYVICLALLLERPERLRSRKFVLSFFSIQLGVILLRNNGLYVVLLAGMVSFFYLFRKYGLRERILCLFASFGGSALAARAILALLAFTCSASPGSMGEMMSLPFQQTARYLQLYQDEIDSQERDAIQAVLGDVGTVAAKYDPASADPVKALFDRTASAGDLASYLKAWLRGFARHPGTYFEAFFLHIYGWFTPAVANSIRYEADAYDAIRQGGLFPGAEKLLIFYYRFAGRTPLGFLENIGLSVWALFFLTFYQKGHGQAAALCAGAPLWVSLLICMASPCFFGHPRYAFPILFTLPFLYGFTLTLAPAARQAARK